jgi:hypothetical protein
VIDLFCHATGTDFFFCPLICPDYEKQQAEKDLSIGAVGCCGG